MDMSALRAFAVATALGVSGCGGEAVPRDAVADAVPEPVAPGLEPEAALDFAACAIAPDPEACAASQEQALIETSEGVVRIADTLVFNTRDGNRVLLVDSVNQNGAGWEYLYSGRIPAANAHLVVLRLYEGAGVVFVSEETGRVTALDAVPLFSPDRTRLITASADTEAGYVPNRVQLFRLDADSLVLEWQVEPSAWEPERPRWMDDRTVEIVRRPAFLNADSASLAIPLTLRREGASWVADTTGTAPRLEHVAEIRRLWEDSSIALCSGDWDGYRRLWATGADVELLHPAGGEWIIGADSITAGYRRLIGSGFRCSYRTVRFRVNVSNDASVAWATVEGLLSAGDQEIPPQRSWYTLVFERTAGEWRLIHAHASVVPTTD